MDTPSAPSSLLAFHQNPLSHPPPCPPTALLVFVHECDAELVKSVHLYVEAETVTVIQQEFRLGLDEYLRVSDPLASIYCSNSARSSSEQLMNTWKRFVTAEDLSWQCILEFHVESPLVSTITPLLSVSSNPALKQLPSLAHELEYVESESHKRLLALECDTSWFVNQTPPATPSKQIKFDWPGDLPLLGNYNNCALPSLLIPNHLAEEAGIEEDVSQKQADIDTFQRWNSGLDLAASNLGSNLFDSCCTIGSSWTCNEDLCLPALESISSPTSSSISRHVDTNCWNPSDILPLDSKFPFGADLCIDESSLSSQSSFQNISDNTDASKLDSDSYYSAPGSPRHRIAQRPVKSDSALNNAVESHKRKFEKSCSLPILQRTPSQSTRASVQSCRRGVSTRSSEHKLQICNRNVDTSAVMKITDDSSVLSCDGRAMETERGALQRGPTERMMEITLEELSQYFHMPITQASKELKVGLTVLKKRCREFGIPRWPHRKLKSLESLIRNIQDLSKDSEGRKNFMDAVRELERQKKSMEENPGIELSERTKRLRQACFKQSYKQRRQAHGSSSKSSF